MWRYDGQELEGIIQAKTESYVAVGWRPRDLANTCRDFPSTALKPRARPSEFHPMDCNDIVIGMAQGSLHRIGDYYTRDRYVKTH